jgi:superfamily II DNA or RNA helicase
VDAALAALRSPLSKGMILADEIGLGKTIEAALVIAQRWAERRRRILLILPATLRKQWQQELLEKFSLPCLILESKSYNQALNAGHPNPFPGGKSCGPLLVSVRQGAQGGHRLDFMESGGHR